MQMKTNFPGPRGQDALVYFWMLGTMAIELDFISLSRRDLRTPYTDCSLGQGARPLKGTYKGEFSMYFFDFSGPYGPLMGPYGPGPGP